MNIAIDGPAGAGKSTIAKRVAAEQRWTRGQLERVAFACCGLSPAFFISAIGAGIRHIIAIDTTMGADAFKDIPEVVAIIHDFNGFERFL